MQIYVFWLTDTEFIIALLLLAVLLLLIAVNCLFGNYFIAAILGEAGLIALSVFLLRLCFSSTIKEVN